jgi:hypothetical protein
VNTLRLLILADSVLAVAGLIMNVRNPDSFFLAGSEDNFHNFPKLVSDPAPMQLKETVTRVFVVWFFFHQTIPSISPDSRSKIFSNFVANSPNGYVGPRAMPHSAGLFCIEFVCRSRAMPRRTVFLCCIARDQIA